VEANRLLMPIEHVTGWLFAWAQSASLSLPQERPESFSDTDVARNHDECRRRFGCGSKTCCRRPMPTPEALFARNVLLEELELAVDELPVNSAKVFCRGTSWKDAASKGDGCRNRREREYTPLAQTLCGPASARAAYKTLRGRLTNT